MRSTINLLTFVLLVSGAFAQSPFAKKTKPNLTFFADAAGTQPISKLESGQTTFYALLPLNKKDFKAPFGKQFAYANYNFLEKNAVVDGLKNGVSTRSEKIYYHLEEMSSTFQVLAADQGKMMVMFKIDDDINFESNVEDVVENGSKVYPLTVRIGKDDSPLGYGVLDWDLSDGGDAYAAAGLASRAYYSFSLSDGVEDPNFKTLVKADIERRFKIKIYQIAHGERVPYTRDLSYYRRNQFGMTYQDLEDENCYTGGISAYEDGAGPGGPYNYDSEGTISQGDQIPCDRVDK